MSVDLGTWPKMPAKKPEIAALHVAYFCNGCTHSKSFGDPEQAESFSAWLATVRGHVITYHRALKSNEDVNAFLTAVYC